MPRGRLLGQNHPLLKRGKETDAEGSSQQKKFKQNKGTKTKKNKQGNTRRAQMRASARWKRKIRQSEKDKGVAAMDAGGPHFLDTGG